jgi:hypothetical protein
MRDEQSSKVWDFASDPASQLKVRIWKSKVFFVKHPDEEGSDKRGNRVRSAVSPAHSFLRYVHGSS